MLWNLGYPDQGLARNQEAVTLAQQIAHPFSLALPWAGLRCSISSVARSVGPKNAPKPPSSSPRNRVSVLEGDRFYPTRLGAGAARTGEGRDRADPAGLGRLSCHRSRVSRPYFLALLADVHGTLGEPEEGLTVLTEALTLVETTGERRYEPELYRLKGELLLQQSSDNYTEAEACFHHALDIARNQQAKSFELRAATSLARLWQQQGKCQEAHDLLAPVYNWFTEGFDTADLKDAKALLDTLV